MDKMRLGVVVITVGLLCGPVCGSARAADASDVPASLKEVKQELQRLREQRAQDRKKMEALEQKVESMEKSAAANEAAQKEVKASVDRVLPDLRALRPGSDRFVLAGYGFAGYQWSDQGDTNSFVGGFNPIFLFRPTDRVLFEAELEVKLPDDAETEVNLEYAQADITLTDYATLVAGKTLLPFGDFIEHLHPAWINKLVSHPLPFREGDEGGILPFSDLGVQLRGAVPLPYGPGTSFDYTVYVANGPAFTSDALGAGFDANNVDRNHGKAYGARFGLQPFPIDKNWGRLHVGASTYNGTWDNSSHWLTSWGLDGVYQKGLGELRGEYISVRRDMPMGIRTDKRDGWYVQGSYKLSSIGVPYLDRTELVTRYSSQNQHAADGDIAPHPRQVSLGVDYWLSPSIVAKLEYDRDMPRDFPDNNEIQAQLAVGF
jgi:hypothetical protein